MSSKQAEAILVLAEALSPTERAAVVVRLLDGIAGDDRGPAQAQIAESQSRLEAVRSGRIELIDEEYALMMIAG